MALKYVLHENPVPPGREEKKAQHARVSYDSKVDMEKLCKLISARSSLSSADVKGVLDSFQFWMGIYLADGSMIELDGLGHFYPTLRSKTIVNERGRPETAVAVDTVGFRCAPKLKRLLRNNAELEEEKRRSSEEMPEQRQKQILAHLREYSYINSSGAMSLNGCSRHVALADLQMLTEAGKLHRIRSGKSFVYLLAE
ncbi:putative histone-like DNA-binding protein [Parabacteroides sp. PF5-5]|uniref:HU family DNA-binding protein n=1 Tax=unclassified Parabacteroides TaxID=2649774 RepID=UPI002472EF41|nr:MULTISPECIES: HU family DNA-binding protein [unclassified Parabacteroides]MDH6303864.1 putative histone-like DNA-binding protein [Parabacteroides sp. PH5-39]MDH6314481.1 putative histone-like DNA-binding protein [Parabacteroides sp. PF5-13]MDH6318454.1 putative histone-like DNA-binding protein [Parabacteroides sp. PH5-13]MDH6322253.1 putative histone-like DNA-binding protein [Parabacteroides sp. PH5-8]MDH6325667.1 putative histone-like DNA-binding protein [Parabacteroides sp. PH5-41]